MILMIKKFTLFGGFHNARQDLKKHKTEKETPFLLAKHPFLYELKFSMKSRKYLLNIEISVLKSNL